MEASFPFLELVLDLQRHVASSYLDFPSRLCFALTSTHCAALVRSDPKRPFRFDGYRFMDESVRLGYYNLVEFAVESGALVDYPLLLALAKAGEARLFEKLLPKNHYGHLRQYQTVEIIDFLLANGYVGVALRLFHLRPREELFTVEVSSRLAGNGFFYQAKLFEPSIDAEIYFGEYLDNSVQTAVENGDRRGRAALQEDV